ncbi:hypothetical protein GTGU_04651 [Trabulsiella guamensis ATCC 49490]|uniref:Uncharacterized protein n=1 Tax=Trabulsiella guamensis ATCC 49490 TaxID=1005994 RepID=A0A084ZIB3_9ENTR|nr:hypothetical protein [Trabulsiella guamensis]KFB97207.1 hypothetical protein GTGU_04651 [Trabulsiella guamensis ATCC 49490]
MKIVLKERVFVNGRWWYRSSFEYQIDGSQFTGFFYAVNRYDAACRLKAIKENAVLSDEDVEFIEK